MHERAHAIVAGRGTAEDPLKRGAVGESNRSTRRINGELSRQVARQLGLIGQHQALEVTDVAKGPPVGQLASRVHRQRRVIQKLLPALADT